MAVNRYCHVLLPPDHGGDRRFLTPSRWERGLVKRPDRHAMFVLERMVNFPEGFIMRGEEARPPKVDEMPAVKVSASEGQVVLELRLHPDDVDAVISGFREAKSEALRFGLEERS